MHGAAGLDPGPGALAVQARGVSVEYERTREKSTLIALEDFTLDVAEGEFLAIVGPSGCGKSTFLNVVAGLVAPAAGEITVYGKPVTGPGPDRAVVFQHSSAKGGLPRRLRGDPTRTRPVTRPGLSRATCWAR